MKQTTKKYLDFINSKFNVLAHTNSLDFDYDYNILENLLADCKQEDFSSNDRILIEFFDTAYYDIKFLRILRHKDTWYLFNRNHKSC